MVHVFKTNVRDAAHAEQLVTSLLEYFPLSKVNFDLEDCDRVLRVEGSGISSSDIILSLKASGFYCEQLE